MSGSYRIEALKGYLHVFLSKFPGEKAARLSLIRGVAIFLLMFASIGAGPLHAQMDPYFTAVNTPVPKGSLMLMLLPDYQVAHTGPNFFTYMGMAEYGVTRHWTAGIMVEGQKIGGLPATYGGLRFNSYFQLFPHDHLLHFTLYGEYEDLNPASLYKMEISGFGSEDLTVPLAVARRTPAHTFEQRVIVYHDWGRYDATFNFVSETDLQNYGNDFGYVLGIFGQPAWSGMEEMGGAMKMKMKMKTMAPPPFVSGQRLGYGLEMTGALGNNTQFGFDWRRQQQYLGPVFTYALSHDWSFRVEPEFGLSTMSDPFVLRMGVTCMVGNFLHRIRRAL
jgi:hypothetical protein